MEKDVGLRWVGRAAYQHTSMPVLLKSLKYLLDVVADRFKADEDRGNSGYYRSGKAGSTVDYLLQIALV
jgi:hypothetical protein